MKNLYQIDSGIPKWWLMKFFHFGWIRYYYLETAQIAHRMFLLLRFVRERISCQVQKQGGGWWWNVFMGRSMNEIGAWGGEIMSGWSDVIVTSTGSGLKLVLIFLHHFHPIVFVFALIIRWHVLINLKRMNFDFGALLILKTNTKYA